MTELAHNLASHLAFSDESYWNLGRYRSISLITCKADDLACLTLRLDEIMKDSGRSEIKWTNITEKTGMALIDLVYTNLDKIRVDILIWDMCDSRHKNVFGRDDTENFCRMYFHLLRNVLTDRWPAECKWALFPDEHDSVDWSKLCGHLLDKGWGFSPASSPLLEGHSFSEFYNIVTFRPVTSQNCPMIQLADFFAGIGAFSYVSKERYEIWKASYSDQTSIFDITGDTSATITLTSSEKSRFPILKYLLSQSAKRKMTLSFSSSGGLSTFNPIARVNFWLYSPQSEKDKAPTKSDISKLNRQREASVIDNKGDTE